MEQDIKQQTVVYNKGITNVPSELLSTDGELVSCEGMTFESGEMKPIQKAVAASVGSISGELMCVHDDRYIYKDGSWLRYKKDNVTGTVMPYSGTLKDVTTVGNTVIAATSEEVHYALWTGSNYTDLGNKIPEPDVRFKLVGSSTDTISVGANIGDNIILDGDIADTTGYNDFIYGLYASARKKCKDAKGFCMPFSLRYAVELYDGSYTMLSSPILFFPCYTHNCYFHLAEPHSRRWVMEMKYCRLYYKCSSDFSAWNDIAKGITVFISDDISIYDTTSDAKFVWVSNEYNAYNFIKASDSGSYQTYGEETIPYIPNMQFSCLVERQGRDIVNELAENSLFYKLCNIKNTSNFKLLDNYKTTDLKNITTLPLLEDEYRSHTSITGDISCSYNGRLNLARISRNFFDGYEHFVGYDREETASTYTITVALKINGGWKHVTKTVTTTEAIGTFFYYPDPRAKWVRISTPSHGPYVLELTEHPGLDGAYRVQEMDTTALVNDGSMPSETYTDDLEKIDNQIAVSEVDNPFVFKAEGYNTVGSGKIIGMAAVTMALSEYQHGKQPLVVFSTDGIWSLTVNSEGYYDAIQAVSREVCNNAKSITQVDMGVYFTSAKGLMYLDTSGVTCVSEQMKGTSFEDFIDTCSIAYDYRDSLLHIFVEDSEYHYVYNMKSGTFSTMADTDLYYKAVNNYPDTLIQTVNDNILSLLSKPDEKDDQNVYEGTLVTRAIKFGNLLTLKSIRQMKHLYRVKAWKAGAWTGHQNAKFSVALTLKASNDGYQWATVHSLRGKPWRYWRFELALGNMSAADRLAGTVVWTQERRTEKIR